MLKQTRLTHLIKSKAKEIGFEQVGISKAVRLEKEAPRLEKWLQSGYHGTMSWMENHFDKRIDPTELLVGAKSIISCTLNYYPEEVQVSDAPKISKYAYGEDYHFVIKRKLKELIKIIGLEVGDINARAFVDSAPIMDKVWAEKSGLGWVGKNTNLIHPKKGSFFFVAEIVLDVELDYDNPINDYCGTCTKCIDECPTGAIVEPYVVDGSKCISYFTIELKSDIPMEQQGKFEKWAFGCDICQDVCPWNKFSKPHSEEAFSPNPKLLSFTGKDWEELSEDVFKEIFKRSAVKRTKFEGLKRNLKFIGN
ncbi:MAG: tRNA epoxyqueuosine(34) reductase QueG [Salibacteraceae bacterium]|mgnify:FL=1|nr:tRNA epoxyqueuosine(34) reductase QueG [Salibacteraceae bacterium]|tara:strand:- start:24832 stop:25755 length:924 start_codon:yes stop_codon:yes gene_type:complete